MSILDKMSAGEHAAVLRVLLKAHPDLQPRAEAIAAEIVSSPSAEDIAKNVRDAVELTTGRPSNGAVGDARGLRR